MWGQCFANITSHTKNNTYCTSFKYFEHFGEIHMCFIFLFPEFSFFFMHKLCPEKDNFGRSTSGISWLLLILLYTQKSTIYIFMPYGSFLGNVWGMIPGVSRSFSGGVWILVGIYIYLKVNITIVLESHWIIPIPPCFQWSLFRIFRRSLDGWSQDKMSTADADELKNLVAELRLHIRMCSFFFCV